MLIFYDGNVSLAKGYEIASRGRSDNINKREEGGVAFLIGIGNSNLPLRYAESLKMKSIVRGK